MLMKQTYRKKVLLIKSVYSAKGNMCKLIDSLSEELFRKTIPKANIITGEKIRYKYTTKSARRKVN